MKKNKMKFQVYQNFSIIGDKMQKLREEISNEFKWNLDAIYSTEEVFNEMGYVAILRDDYFIDCINESNKKDALKMIDYGINYQYKRIDDNNKYCKSYMDKLENETYLKGLIKKLEAKKAEIYGYNKGQITK